MSKKVIAVIPARFASTRFPAKMLAILNGLPIIAHTFLSVKKCNLFDKIIVATDNDLIDAAIKKQGGEVFRSKKEHLSGTDRIAEVMEYYDADIIINVQGDEPFIQTNVLQKVIQCFDDESVDVASVMKIFENFNFINNVNFVKVVVTQANFAMYFSRSPIPYLRNCNVPISVYHHIGIYGFTKKTLMAFAKHDATPCELAEQIEAIRFLEMGLKMKMALTEYSGIQIDTKEDFERASNYLKTLDR